MQRSHSTKRVQLDRGNLNALRAYFEQLADMNEPYSIDAATAFIRFRRLQLNHISVTTAGVKKSLS